MVTMTRSHGPPPSARVAVVVVAAVALASCGSGSGSKRSAGSGVTSTTSASTTSTTSTACRPGATTEQQTPPSTDVVRLTGLTTASRHCGDDVTFIFRGTPAAIVPGYDVRSGTPPFRDSGEGRVHAVQGDAFLVVRFDRASITDFTNPSAPLTYTGPTSLHPTGLAHVRDVELLDATEGVLSWVIGLDAPRPFRVDTATTPGAVTVAVG